MESLKQSIDKQKSINQSLDKLDKYMINSRGSLVNPSIHSVTELHNDDEDFVYKDINEG